VRFYGGLRRQDRSLRNKIDFGGIVEDRFDTPHKPGMGLDLAAASRRSIVHDLA
jgi:hypothetical protein